MLRNNIVARHHPQNTAIEALDISMVMAVGSSGGIGNADLAYSFVAMPRPLPMMCS
jgi:hypothetical protein